MHLYYHYLDWDCYLLLICNTVMALLVNEFYVRSILLGQLSLAAVSHIYVFREVMTLQNLKIHSKLALKMIIFIYDKHYVRQCYGTYTKEETQAFYILPQL